MLLFNHPISFDLAQQADICYVRRIVNMPFLTLRSGTMHTEMHTKQQDRHYEVVTD